jgi:hypothetical protein
MATILSVKEQWPEMTGVVNEKYLRKYPRVFHVEVDVCDARPPMFIGDPLLPFIGDAYPTDATVYCREITIKRDGKRPTRWIVTCEYSSGEAPTEQNPLDRPPTWNFEPGLEREAARNDLDGELLGSSAGEPFDPPVEIDRPTQIARIQRNVANHDPDDAATYIGALNTVEWIPTTITTGTEGTFTPAARTCKCTRFTGEEVYEGEYHFWRESLEFHRRLEGEYPQEFLDQGTYGVDIYGTGTAELERYQFLDPKTGRPVTSPVLMDGQGGQLPQGDTPVFLAFRLYREKDFNDLGL